MFQKRECGFGLKFHTYFIAVLLGNEMSGLGFEMIPYT